MAFWFDPARDFLLALDNLKKPTLIGQPTGIPGLFYGPYWIWLISFGLLISRNPLIVTIIILTIPYVLFFPYFLSKLDDFIGKKSWTILWPLFYLSSWDYIVSIWNPHLAPLAVLFFIYLMTLTLRNKKTLEINKLILAGFAGGLIVNFHFSFGLGVLVGSYLFLISLLIIEIIQNKDIIWEVFKREISGIIFFSIGVMAAFAPFVFFEARHGFNQTKSLLKTITDSFLYNTPAVGYVGLSSSQINQQTINRFFKLLGIEKMEIYFTLVFFLGLFFFIFNFYYKKIQLNLLESKLVLLLLLILGSILTIYKTSENPVWVYHFIGIEVIYLLLIGIFINKFKFFRKLLIIWVLIIAVVHIYTYIVSVKVSSYSLSSITTKKHIVDTIFLDDQDRRFTVFVYSPSIYTFDYDYIFAWYAKDKYLYMPDREIKGENPVYLIIPKTDPGIFQDFINYKAPDLLYKTDKEWVIEDGTTILKRQRLLK